VSSARSLAEHISEVVGKESKITSVPKDAILAAYNPVHLDNDAIFFKHVEVTASKRYSIYEYKGTKFVIPQYISKGHRTSRSDGYVEPLFDKKEWADTVLELFPEANTYLLRTVSEGKLTFSQLIDDLVTDGIINLTREYRLHYTHLHGRRLVEFEQALNMPGKFIVSDRVKSLFSIKDNNDGLYGGERTITDEYIAELKQRATERDLAFQKKRANTLCRNHSAEGNKNQYILAMYYICAGLDDYDTREVFEGAPAVHGVESLANLCHWEVAMLQMITKYSNNTASYHYGMNSKAKAEEYLENSPFEKADLLIPEFEIAAASECKNQLDRIVKNTKFDLASFSIVEEIV